MVPSLVETQRWSSSSTITVRSLHSSGSAQLLQAAIGDTATEVQAAIRHPKLVAEKVLQADNDDTATEIQAAIRHIDHAERRASIRNNIRTKEKL